MDGRELGVADPTLAPDADFWNGWSAVRYLNDQFDRLYRRECALIVAILPLLRPTDAFSLRARTVVLERTPRHLDQLGRRQGMTGTVAALVYRFLKLLRTAQVCCRGPAVKAISVRVTALAKAEADSSDRRQQRCTRRARQLSAQVPNMDIDHIALRVEVHIPYFL